MRQSRPSLRLPLLNRMDWHSMTSPRAESADTCSRTFSSEIPVSVAISESSRSPRSFRYFRISCKALLLVFYVGTRWQPEKGDVFYAKVTGLAIPNPIPLEHGKAPPARSTLLSAGIGRFRASRGRGLYARRARAGLAGASGTHHRQLSSRRIDRSLRARLRRNAFTQPRPGSARREPRGRGRGHRLRGGRQIARRRLHVPVHHLDPDRAGASPLQEAALRPGQGLHFHRSVRFRPPSARRAPRGRSEEHTSELQSRSDLVCRLLLEKKKTSTRAASSAFGLSVITAWSAGPLRSKAAMRARHICTSFSAVNVPASNATLMSAMVADSKSIVFARTGASASTMVAARTAHIWRFFFLRSRRPPNPPFFPYTSLFR